jgi:hypothetical protein
MEERLRFVPRLIEGEAMTDLCRELSVCCKTGYKVLNRYKGQGPIALTDRSRRPVRDANQPPPLIEALIVRVAQRLKRLLMVVYGPYSRRQSRQRPPDWSMWMMPLLTRRSSSRARPVKLVGRSDLIGHLCLSFSHKGTLGMHSPREKPHRWKRITVR